MHLDVAGRRIGVGCPCFVIAEAGVNHNGDVRLAEQLVDAAVKVQADAVKFQTFHADRLATAQAPKAAYQARTTQPEESQLQMLRRLELSAEAHHRLADYCRQRKILFLSTPFDVESVALLEALSVPAFKIGSGDLTNLPLLRRVAQCGKPMIVSTGMATLAEVRSAVAAIQSAAAVSVALLHCVSSYPADPADVNLRAMQTLADACGLPVGYSDHTLGIEVALGAVALGACIIEKHLTLDRRLPGPDHAASIEPEEFGALVRGIRLVEAALGDGHKRPTPQEQEVAAVARKSLVAARDIPSGTTLTAELVAVKRPGTGISPREWDRVMGCRTRRALHVDECLIWSDLS